MTAPHVVELLPAYALGTLREEELRQVVEHVADCPGCQHELEAYREVVGQIPLALAGLSPSPRVKAAIFEQIPPAPSSAKAGWWSGFVSSFHRLSPVMGLVSLVLIVLLLIANILLWQQVREVSRSVPQQFRVVEMTNTDAAPQAYGWMVMSQDGRYGTLIVDGLPELEEGMAYQLWLSRGDERTSGGVFSVGWSGYGAVKINAPENLDTYSRIGITIEPAGGSPGPTGERVLSADL